MIVAHKMLNTPRSPRLNCRTVTGIQEKIVEKGGRNFLSRLAHAKNDKETIAAWKLDLNRILHVFNVSLVISVRPSPTVHWQTELAINTHTMVFDIHRNIPRGQEGSDNQHWLVSDICNPFHYRMNNRSPLPRPKPGQ